MNAAMTSATRIASGDGPSREVNQVVAECQSILYWKSEDDEEWSGNGKSRPKDYVTNNQEAKRPGVRNTRKI